MNFNSGDGGKRNKSLQTEHAAGLLFFNLTCSWDWFIRPRFCYLRYIHPRIVWVVAWFWGNILSLEDKVLEALALGANKFNLRNGNLTINIHPFCGLFHLCVSGDRVVTKGTVSLLGCCCLCFIILLPLLCVNSTHKVTLDSIDTEQGSYGFGWVISIPSVEGWPPLDRGGQS